MPFLKLNAGAGVAFIILAMLMATCQPVLAASTTLVCTRPPPNDRKITIDLNEAKGTATVNYAAWDSMPASSLGPIAATFDSKTVTFDTKNGTRYDHYTIDRVTLDFTNYGSEGAPFDQAAQQDRVIYEYTCSIGKKQF